MPSPSSPSPLEQPADEVVEAPPPISLCPRPPSGIKYAPTRQGLPPPLLPRLLPDKPHNPSSSLYAPLSGPPHPTSSMTTPTPSRHQPFGTGVGGEIDEASSSAMGQLMSIRRLMIVKSRILAV
jgi:hypothetical protein